MELHTFFDSMQKTRFPELIVSALTPDWWTYPLWQVYRELVRNLHPQNRLPPASQQKKI